jgi:hypothetical protein
MFLVNREESFLYQGRGPMGHILPAERRKIQGGWWGGGESKGCVVFVIKDFYVVTVLDYGVLIAYTLYPLQHKPSTLLM